MNEERSPGGSRIHRHDAPPDDPKDVPTGWDGQEEVERHVEGALGEIEFVFHELASPLVHLDVLSVGPARGRGFRTLVTSGMSARPMTDPPDPALRRAELCICLPRSWPTDSESWKEHRHYWPIELLKFLGRFPHGYRTWLWADHTIPNGDPPEPYDDTTELCGAMLIPPVHLPEQLAVLERPGEDDVHFLMVVPLHADEMAFKLEHGAPALYDAMAEARVEVMVDPRRPSVVGAKRRRRFGLF